MISENQIQDIIDTNDDYSRQYFVWKMDPDNSSLEQFYLDALESELDEKVIALMQHTNDYYSNCKIFINKFDWLVLTEEEADDKIEEYAQDYLADLLYGQSEIIKRYFNRQAFLDDYMAEDRAAILASYDGYEYTEYVNKICYYLYKR